MNDLLRQKTWHVLWVSRDPIGVTRDYCRAKSIPFSDVVADPTHRTYLQLGLQFVPSTAVIGPGGVVEKVWRGRLDPEGWKRMFAYSAFPGDLLSGAVKQAAWPADAPR